MPHSHPHHHHPPHSLRHGHRHPPPPLLLPHPYHHGNHPPPPPGQGFPTPHPHPHHGPRFRHPPPLHHGLPQQSVHRHPHQHQHQHLQQNLQESRLHGCPVRYPGDGHQQQQQQQHYRHRHPHPHQHPPPPPHSPHPYPPHSQPGANVTPQGNPHARGITPPQQHALSPPPPPPPPHPLLTPPACPPPPSSLLHSPPPYLSHPHPPPPPHQPSEAVASYVEASGQTGRDGQGFVGVSSDSSPAEQQVFAAPGTLEPQPPPPPPHPSQRQSASAPTPTHHHHHTHLPSQQPDPSRSPEEAPGSPSLAKPDPPQKDSSPPSSSEASSYIPEKTSRSVSGDQASSVGEVLKRVSLQDRGESGPPSLPSPPHAASVQPASKRRRGQEEEEGGRGVVERQKSPEQQKQRAKELCEKEMQAGTIKVFPNLLNTTLHLPPQHFNKMAVKADKARGDLLVQDSGSSDMGCDRAEQDVRHCLEVIRDLTGEVVCAFFNYPFDNYLEKKDPLPSQNGKRGQLTRQVSPPSRAWAELDACMDEVTTAGSCQGDSSTVPKEAAASLTTHVTCSSKQRRRRKTSPDSDLDKPTVSTEELESVLSQELGNLESVPGQNSQPQQASATTSSPRCGKTSKKRKCPKKSQNDKKKPAGMSDPQNLSLTPKSLFPSPGDLDVELRRGDFDVLVVSCRHGCLLLEIKGVGYNQGVEGAILEKKALKAVDQLDKQEKVLRFLFQDLLEDLPVSKGLALPNVQRHQLRQLCLQEPSFAQTLCSCCGTCNTEEALATVLCADDIPTPLPPHPLPSPPPDSPSHQALLQWWHHVTKGHHSGNRGGPDTGEGGRKDVLEETVYQGIISRLAGPYSRVTVESTRRAAEARTIAECIHLTGLKYGRTLLRSDQLHLLDCPESFLYLTGPPGSGKTLLLGLKGLQWARQGDHVVVLVPRGVGWGSLVSLTLYQRIRHYARLAPHPQRNHHRDPSETRSPKHPSIHKDTGNETPSSEQTALADNTLTENDSSSERCPCPNETQPGKLEQHLQQTASAQTASDDLQNIHTATVEKSEDTERFVQELLCRYSDRPLRILVDEGPTKVNVNYLHRLLREGLESLEQGVLRVRSLLERGGGGTEGGGGGVSRGHDLDLEARSSGWLFSLSSASPECVSKVKRLVQKVEHHLQTIKERMPVLQPPHGRPPLTQTNQWSVFMSGIRKSHGHLVAFIHDLQGLLTTLLRPPGDAESPTELGSDVSKLSSEDVLTRSREEVLQNQESNRDTCPPGPGDVNATSPATDVAAKSSNAIEDDVSETGDLNSPGSTLNSRGSTLNSPKSTEGVSKIQKPPGEDLSRICVPISKQTNPATEESCVRSCSELSNTTPQLSSGHTGELPSVPAPESSVPQTSASAGAAHDHAADQEHRSPHSCQHQNHLQEEPDRQLRGTDKDDDPHAATEGDPPGGVVGREVVGEVPGVEEVVRVGVGEVPGVDEAGRGMVGEVSGVDEAGRGMVGEVSGVEEVVGVGVGEVPGVDEAGGRRGTVGEEVPFVEEVVSMLDRLEADMLESSGKLFNVETQMDFAVISDVLSVLVKHRGRQELSVWSSGVTPFYHPPGFQLKNLEHCLRCPPTVQHVLSLVEKDLTDCPDYHYTTGSLQDEEFPLPTNGPPVRLLSHASHVTKVKDILDCWECGHALADYLTHTLRLGQPGSVNVEDVAISGSLDISHVQRRPCLMALTDRGIQLQFPSSDLTSPPPYPGHMFIIGGCAFQGLESKVVVFIPDVSRISQDTSDVKEFRPDLPPWLRDMGRWNRCHLWFVASRCLSQLVVFHV